MVSGVCVVPQVKGCGEATRRSSSWFLRVGGSCARRRRAEVTPSQLWVVELDVTDRDVLCIYVVSC